VGLYLLRWKKLFSPAFFHGWGLVLGILSRPDHAPRYKKTHPKTGAFLVILKSKFILTFVPSRAAAVVILGAKLQP